MISKIQRHFSIMYFFVVVVTGQQVINDFTHKVVIKEDGTQSLIIVPVAPSDSGEWIVVAQNRAGKSSISVTLTVEGTFFLKIKEEKLLYCLGFKLVFQPYLS